MTPGTTSATSPLRLVGYSLVLTALAFVQQPGRLVGDTKFDLVVDPARFLGRALHLWDPQAAFGQVQNQAYGYLWPMGPFFLVGDLAHLPGWVVQRLWWSVLLVVAFLGVVRLARALRLGTPGAQVLAAFAFALSPHVLTLLGPTSVEAWPTALAPWVLLPLVRGAEGGSPRRAAALSALAVAMAGGVNAVAAAAVLPVGVVWLLTRTRGPRRRSLMLWWPTLTVLATLWWSLPLVLLGRYSPPFLDYIENAAITTSTTSLPDVLAGTSDWVAYASPLDWVAGHLLGTTPLLLVDAAAVAALGLAGVVRRDNPHGRFLILSVVAGVGLVTFGYAGPVHGWLAADRQDLLDAALAPLRNLHKFDAVLRLPLVLGLAHLVGSVLGDRSVAWGRRAARGGVVLAAVSAAVGVALPAYTAQLAPPASVQEVPGYWYQAAGFLARHGDEGTALEVPASGFGDYLWGSPHDDVLQTLARSPWAVRNVIPLAQPGNVRMLDAVTRVVELGRPDPTLAAFLRSNGVGYLVVRNDLAPFRTGAPDPVVLHQALDRSTGLRRVAQFGPEVGDRVAFRVPSGTRVLNNRGRQARYPAVEVYQVMDGAPRVTAWQADTVPVVSGGPGDRLGTDLAGQPSVLAGDARAGRFGPGLLTDGLRRREVAFTSVRDNHSATMTAGEPWRLGSVEHTHRIYGDMARWETVARWHGARDVTASSSPAYADAYPPLDPGRSPAAALDGDQATAFSTASLDGARDQWWRVELGRPRVLDSVRVTLGASPRGEVERLALVTDGGRVTVRAPRPGRTATYFLPPGRTSFLEVRAAGVAQDGPGAQLVLQEVSLPAGTPRRWLATPSGVLPAAPAEVVLRNDPTRPSCAEVAGTTTCDDSWRTTSQDGVALRRILTLAGPATYRPELTALVRPTTSAADRLAAALPVRVSGSRPLSTDLAGSALAAVDKDSGTTWVADATDPTPYLELSWDGTAELRSVDAVVGATAAASAPTLVRLVSGDRTRLVRLDRRGHGEFPPLTTDRVRVEFLQWSKAYSFERGGAVQLPVGVSELRLPGVPGLADLSPFDPLDLGCGSGPSISVAGRTHPTRVRTDLRAVLLDQPVTAQVCPAVPVPLRAGAQTVRVTPSAAFAPEQLTLRRTTAASVAPQPVRVALRRWDGTSRAVQLPDRASATLLTVNENINAGWQARLGAQALRPQRVDGWRQGWLVPAGPAGTVRLAYTPDRPYRLSLAGGALAAALVAVLALWPGRRRQPPPLTTATRAGWADSVAVVLLGGLLAGWVGSAVAVLVLLARAVSGPPRWAAWTAAALVGAAGAVMALARAHGFVASVPAAQVLACLALAVAVLGAKGPAFLSRRNGRSTT